MAFLCVAEWWLIGYSYELLITCIARVCNKVYKLQEHNALINYTQNQ